MSEADQSQRDLNFRNPVQGLHEFANLVTLFRKDPPSPHDPEPKQDQEPTVLEEGHETPLLKIVKVGENILTFARPDEPVPTPNALGRFRGATQTLGNLIARR